MFENLEKLPRDADKTDDVELMDQLKLLGENNM